MSAPASSSGKLSRPAARHRANGVPASTCGTVSRLSGGAVHMPLLSYYCAWAARSGCEQLLQDKPCTTAVAPYVMCLTCSQLVVVRHLQVVHRDVGRPGVNGALQRVLPLRPRQPWQACNTGAHWQVTAGRQGPVRHHVP
jgi:hypothetical protein